MKIFPILLTVILMISCAQHPSPKQTSSSTPVEEIPPISNQTAESNPSLPEPDKIVAVVPVKIPASSITDEISMEDLSKKEKLNRLKTFGLDDLEKQQITKDDLEIRVWQISGLFMREYKNSAISESVFILKRVNGNWSAEVIRNTIKGKSQVEKLIRTKLDEPKSGWENVWQNFVNNELLTFPDSVSGKVEYATDAGSCIIEPVCSLLRNSFYSDNGIYN